VKSLPRLGLAVRSWRNLDVFYYLHISHPANTNLDRLPNAARATSSRPWLARTLEGVSAVLALVEHFWHCFWLPRGRDLIFNHSARIRRNAPTNLQALYLAKLDGIETCVISEDHSTVPAAALSPYLIQGFAVDRAAELFGGMLHVSRQLLRRPSDRIVCNFYLGRALWRLTFLIVRPRRLLMLVWYTKLAVIAAAHEIGVACSDLQHGVIYQDHPFYRPPPSSPGLFLSPDRFLVYGEYWKEKLTSVGWAPSRLGVIGYFLQIDSTSSSAVSEPYVLYTSQPLAVERIKAHIRSISAELASSGRRIVIAPHPMDAPHAFDDVVSDAVRVVSADSYDLLRNCEVHVSLSSTLLWEAILFGKSSYTLTDPQQAVDTISDLVRFGFARYIKDREWPRPFELPRAPSGDYVFRTFVEPILG
jgi:hypothetical protein